MSYSVKEIYYTLQGEGHHTGRPAVFLRFAGCNLWNGLEADRETAICKFCDTDFFGLDGPNGGKFENADSLANRVAEIWGAREHRFVVCTGGEPLLQIDEALIDALHENQFEVAVETNGTLPAPDGLDWTCVSPKAEAELIIRSGKELKLVFPQKGAEPERFVDLDFDQFYLQPMDGPELKANTVSAVDYCKQHPKWQLSLQTHKLLGIP